MEENFRFDVSSWYRTIVDDVEIPPDADVRIVLDTSFTAQNHSDRSALICGYKYAREDGITEFVLLDCRSERWKGGALADAALDFWCEQTWKPSQLRIEDIPGVDLLVDTIRLKCELRHIEMPHIVAFPRDVRKGAKNTRILRLASLFECDPPAIRIRRGPHVGKLLEEVRAFISAPQNRGRQVGLLDALAISCFR